MAGSTEKPLLRYRSLAELSGFIEIRLQTELVGLSYDCTAYSKTGSQMYHYQKKKVGVLW